MSCPIRELLLEGTRGCGKTNTLLMDFAQHVGEGYGAHWRGIVFRRTYPELRDLIAKSKQFYNVVFPEAKYNSSSHCWIWPTGETFYFSYMRTSSDYWCVPYGEVLTRRGWVPIEDVAIGEYALTCNLDTMKLDWLPVLTMTVERYSSDLVIYNGRGINMVFTEAHRLPTMDRVLLPYNKLPREAFLLCGGWKIGRKGIDRFELNGIKSGTKESLSVTGDDFCSFMGWWLSEGHVLPVDSKKNVVGIAQTKKDNRVEIENLLRSMGISYNYSGHQYVFRSKLWANYLRQFKHCRDKFIPKEILHDANSRQLKLFLDAFISGDGTRQKNRLYAFTSSGQLADDLCTVGVLLGYSPHVSSRQRENRNGLSYQVTFNPRTARRLYTDNRLRKLKKLSHHTQVRREKYNGLVYCLGFGRNHTFFIRQHGSVWLSGNSYHGHEYPLVYWEELTSWPSPDCYEQMKSCNRSSFGDIPRKYRATTNPYGVGHSWVKDYFVDPAPPLTVMFDEAGDPRIRVHGDISENVVLLKSDPDYLRWLSSIKDPNLRKAWRWGSWDIVAGGAITDLWDERVHVVQPFTVPSSWYVDRSFDWGSSKPFAVLWWAESDGSRVQVGNKVRQFPAGTLFLIAEWYGWNGSPNVGCHMIASEIARKILSIEKDLPIMGTVRPGPADASIYDSDVTIAADMARAGVKWFAADKRPGSRVAGLERLRAVLMNSLESPMEEPGFFVFETCRHFLRTVPTLPRDPVKLDDVDSDAEDHIYDAVRYRLMTKRWTVTSQEV